MSGFVIAISGVSGNVAQGVIKALREGPREWRLLGFDASEDCVGYHLVDEHARLPLVRDASYLDALVTALRQRRCDLYIPAIDSEIELIAAHRESISAASGSNVIISSHSLVRRMVDKQACQELLAEHGLPTAHTRAADGDAAELAAYCGLPLVAKPRHGNAARGVLVLESLPDLRAFLAPGRPEYCLQEYLQGDEYTCALVFDRAGDLRDFISLRRTLVAGTTMSAVVEMPSVVRDLLVRFGGCIRAEGPINLQLRYPAGGTPVIFEINPRFSGTTGVRAALGFNDARRIVEHYLTGAPIAPQRPLHAVAFGYLTELVVPLA